MNTLLLLAVVGRLGIGMECLDRDLWNPEPAYSHLSELGVKRARLQSGWARTEKEKGRYDFAWLDKIVDELVRRGVEPWLSLSYGNPIYAAACDGEQDYTGQKMNPLHSPKALEAWKAYVQTIVARYRDKVSIWEVWNEPDCGHFFKPLKGKTWVDEYLELLKVTSETVKSVLPEAKVVAQTAAGHDGRERRVFELFERGAGKYADIYTFHAYSARPEDFTRNYQDAFFGPIRKLAPHIEIWRGEAGISSKNSGRGALSNLPLSESLQVNWMTRHLVRDLADPQIAYTSYFHLFDFDHYSHEVTYHYGVLRDKDYSRKPSFYALWRIKRLFDDGHAKVDPSLHLAFAPHKTMTAFQTNVVNGVAVYPFRRNGLPMIAYTASVPVTDPLDPFKARVHTTFGNSKEVWKDPVLFDLVDGSLSRPPLRKDWPEWKLEVDVKDHVVVLTEAAALGGIADAGKLAPAEKVRISNSQVDHE